MGRPRTHHAAPSNLPDVSRVEELTIAGVHADFAAGNLTIQHLVNEFAARIKIYNPRMYALLELNPDANTIAAQLDKERVAAGGVIGAFMSPAHCP
eukprot:SM007338S21734  [mRNA]  locus=s7338:63:449:- [translate_table: standard]